MAVYIKGRKIPKSCYDCEFVYWSTKQRASACFLLPFMKCFESHSTEYREKRSEHCPLIEVPEPHGDLIDRKALDIYQRAEAAHAEYQEDEDNEYLEGMSDGLCEAVKQLSVARTIIPASKEGL